eukprot:Pgem_evm3s19037
MSHTSKVRHDNFSDDIIDVDIMGPMNKPSTGGKKYALMIVHRQTKFTWMYPITTKDQKTEAIEDFLDTTCARHQLDIKRIHSDNEFRTKAIETICSRRGIEQSFTSPGTSLHNAYVERRNGITLEMARAMLEQNKTSKHLWAEALTTAVTINNMLPTKGLQNGITPWEAFYNKKPSVEKFYEFGAKTIMYKDVSGKLSNRGTPVIMISPCFDTIGTCYRLYNPKTRAIVRSRDIKVFENSKDNTNVVANDNANDTNHENEEENLEEGGTSSDEDNTSDDEVDTQQYVEEDEVTDEQPQELLETVADRVVTRHNTQINYNVWDRVKAKIRNPETEIINWETGTIHTVEDNNKYTIKFDNDNIISHISNKNIQPQHRIFSSTEIITEPKTFKQALTAPDCNEWINSMKIELQALQENNTFSKYLDNNVPNIIGMRFVYKVKRNQDNKFIKRKSRLVAKGYSQEFGVDYYAHSSPVMSKTSIRLLVVLSVQSGLQLYQFDSDNAFAQSNLKEKVIVKFPEGIHLIDKGLNSTDLYLLNKSLYGLVQAGRTWFDYSSDAYQKCGFTRLKSDPCIFSYPMENYTAYLGVYVDDCVLVAKTKEDALKIMKPVFQLLKMQFLGTLTHFLGWKFEYIADGVFIHQKNYINECVKRFELEQATPRDNPMPTYPRIDGTPFTGPYQGLIGSLLYASCSTHPQIQASVSICSKYNTKPTQYTWRSAKTILRYLKGVANKGLLYKKSASGLKIEIYCDSDYANDESRKSRTGIITTINGTAIHWDSTLQKSIATSSCEAEYMACCQGAKAAKWLINVLQELNVKFNLPITMYCDNQSAIAISNDYYSSKRAKHIDIQYHFTREMIEAGLIQVLFCPTKENIADIMTKPLSGTTFEYLSSLLISDGGVKLENTPDK